VWDHGAEGVACGKSVLCVVAEWEIRGGPMQQAHLFVAVLGASSYTYVEAMRDEQLASWIGARRHPGPNR
jgi:transposase